MIQTIVLIQNGKYPFGETTLGPSVIKVEDIRIYQSVQQLKYHKNKMQSLFTLKDRSSHTTITQSQHSSIIKLLKIYQSDLTLHYLFEYVPHSLQQFIENKLISGRNTQKTNILQMNSKLLIKKIYYQLGSIINYLIKYHIKTNLTFDLLGMDQDQNLRLFVDPSCKIIPVKYIQKSQFIDENLNQQIQDEIKKQYNCRKEQILMRLQKQFQKFKSKDYSIPNFIIQGNKLIFCHTPILVSNQNSISPSICSFSESSFTDRSQTVNNFFYNNQTKNVDEELNLRRTHGNLFSRLNKRKSQEYVSQTNKKIQQNLRKLQMLRQKSKKLNDEVYNAYLSNSQNIQDYQIKKESFKNPQNDYSVYQPNSFRKMSNNQEKHWRNSQIPKKFGKTQLPGDVNSSSVNSRFRNNFDGKRSKSTRSHKGSFQFKPHKNEKQWFNPNKSFDKNYDDEFQDKSFQQKKSIRIELQQTTLGNKQRKNSYKVKILTCQQMQVDGDNVQEFVFNAMNKNFSQQERNNEQQQNEKSNNQDDNFEKSSVRSKKSNHSSRYQNLFSANFKDKDNQSQFRNGAFNVRQKGRQNNNSSQKNIFEKYYEQFGKQEQKSSKNIHLQEKIRLAKLKAQNVLNKYMKTKKNGHNSSNSKLGL